MREIVDKKKNLTYFKKINLKRVFSVVKIAKPRSHVRGLRLTAYYVSEIFIDTLGSCTTEVVLTLSAVADSLERALQLQLAE